jgi:hypothetical protein
MIMVAAARRSSRGTDDAPDGQRLGRAEKEMTMSKWTIKATCAALALAAVVIGPLARSECWARRIVVGPLQSGNGASGEFRENIVGTPSGLTGGLTVRGQGLTPGKTYTVTTGGTTLGTMKANRAGRARAAFLARPRGLAQGLATDPRGKVLAVTDPDNTDPNSEDVMEGDVGDPTTPGSIPCCLNTTDEQGCADLLPDECTAAGGTAVVAATCDPDPCPGQGGTPGAIACCLSTPDQQGCDEILPADCTAAGGTVAASATSCDPDPCPGQSSDGETDAGD